MFFHYIAQNNAFIKSCQFYVLDYVHKLQVYQNTTKHMETEEAHQKEHNLYGRKSSNYMNFPCPAIPDQTVCLWDHLKG